MAPDIVRGGDAGHDKVCSIQVYYREEINSLGSAIVQLEDFL